MAISVNEIETKQWSPNIGSFGEVVTNQDDIKQAIFLIVSTVKGTVAMLPDFGCGLFEWIDEPINSGAPKMARDIRNAVSQWEKRVSVKNVSYTLAENSVYFKIEVTASSSVRLEADRIGSAFIGLEVTNVGEIFLVDNFNRRILTEFGYIIF